MKSQKKILFQITVLILASIYSTSNLAQNKFVLKNVISSKLPKNIKWQGDLNQAFEWQDSLGHNIFITSSKFSTTDTAVSFNRSTISQSLYVYHFLIVDSIAKPIWRFADFFDKCENDVQSQFFRNSYSLTDLNNDGIGEMWFMYKNTCSYENNPYTMKIVMNQCQEKYAIKGECRVKLSPTEFGGGNFEYADAMITAPDDFKKYAEKLWNQNIDGH